MMAVGTNIVVSIRYLMKNGRGEVLEDRMNAAATQYLQGSSAIDRGLQAQMEGLGAGERRIIRLRKGEGGADQQKGEGGTDQQIGDDGTDDDFIFEVVVDGLRAATEAELLLGYPLDPGDAQCDPDCICHFKPGP